MMTTSNTFCPECHCSGTGIHYPHCSQVKRGEFAIHNADDLARIEALEAQVATRKETMGHLSNICLVRDRENAELRAQVARLEQENAELKGHLRWRSLATEPPMADGCVLIHEIGDINVGLFWYETGDEDNCGGGDGSHWLPIPPLPNEAQQEPTHD